MYMCTYHLFVGMWRPGECYYNTLLSCDYFSSSSVVSRTLCMLCMQSKFGHHPHPPGYLCAKFCFFRSLNCWANPWGEIAYSVKHSMTHSPSLFYAPRSECCHSEHRAQKHTAVTRHWKTSETEPRDDRNYWPSGNINIGNLLVSSMCSRNLYTCNDNLHSAPRQNHRQHISVVSCKALPKITGKVKNLTPVKS